MAHARAAGAAAPRVRGPVECIERKEPACRTAHASASGNRRDCPRPVAGGADSRAAGQNVARTTILQDAWRNGHNVQLHGWCYGLKDGIISDLKVSLQSPVGS